MSTPKVAGRQPIKLDLESGEHYWCACGLSKAQPFCDGSHRGTGIEPLAFHVEEPQEGYLCLCKQTKNPPYCDGSHNHLSSDSTEAPANSDSEGMTQGQNTPEEPTLELIHALARD